LEKDIFHIASDYFSGRITEENKLFIENWLKQTPENREVFSELEKVWKLTGTLNKSVDANIDEEWTKFVKLREELPVKTNTSIKLKILRIAAILIPAILVISFTLYYFNGIRLEKKWTTLIALERTQLELPDGSEIWVNKNSTFQYPAKFGKKQRLVKLHGEAFFKVSKSHAPFIVDAGNTTIKVLGTQFNVKNSLNYSTTEVFVNEGKVLFSSKAKLQNNVTLHAGDKGLFLGNECPIKKETVKTSNAAAWVIQKLTFHNTTLRQVKIDLENYFGQTVVISEGLENCLFSGDFNNPDLNNILEIISLSVGCNLRFDGNIAYLDGGGCEN
jgi:ferric-dicitrate binding protein FerR (iron transport regulator)